MENTSNYKFTDKVKEYTIHGYFPSKEDSTMLVQGTLKLKGIQAFGPSGGVITEEDLSPEVVEFLLNRRGAPKSLDPNDSGELLYAHLLVKKDIKKDK